MPEPRLNWVKENNEWRNLVRSYLACTSFVDAQVGRLLAALDEAGVAENTIVVLWGDHGWHLGEKGITGKNTLWDRGSKVPLIFAGPGVKGGQRCLQPAELLDLYPTLIELTGIPARTDLEGMSLVPQLRNAATKRERPAVTSHNQGNHGIRSERWRYIHYADGSEELYDMQADPNEWHNLAGKTEHATIIAEHKKWLPKIDRPPFDRVDHDQLMSRVAQKVRDKRLLRLIGDYLRAPLQTPDGRREKRLRGTPQGGPLSPLPANIYLDPLDREREQRGLSFVRYADDIAIFVASARSAERVAASVIAWIEKHLKVEVNRDKSGSGPSDQSGLPGIRLYADGRIGVAPKTVERLKATVRELWDARQSLTSEQLRDQRVTPPARKARGRWRCIRPCNKP